MVFAEPLHGRQNPAAGDHTPTLQLLPAVATEFVANAQPLFASIRPAQ
jgi:hypothetical protein